ncbi:MAG: ATP-binding cassette domain-containing protein, partial [Vicinamibacterales bacterium]
DALSGGNQQKVVAGKWLATSPRVLLLDEPTKGVDVGAKFEIHNLIRREADAGMACLMVSSDLPEVLALADRILVMREGRLRGELVGADATDEAVMRLATHDVHAGAGASA